MMNRQAEILRIEGVFFNALVGVQVGQLEELLTDDFLLADLSGGLMSKAALIDAIRSGRLRFEVIEPMEAAVRFYGPTAIASGRTQTRGRFEETLFVAQSRYTHIYIERERKFYLAAAQGTPIAADEN
jgi:hypothetical protein